MQDHDHAFSVEESDDEDLCIVYEDGPSCYDPNNYKNRTFCVGDTIIEPLDNISSDKYYRDNDIEMGDYISHDRDNNESEDEVEFLDYYNNSNSNNYTYTNNSTNVDENDEAINRIRKRLNKNYKSSFLDNSHNYNYNSQTQHQNQSTISETSPSTNNIESEESEIKIINTFSLSTTTTPMKNLLEVESQEQTTPSTSCSYLDVLTTVKPTDTWW